MRNGRRALDCFAEGYAPTKDRRPLPGGLQQDQQYSFEIADPRRVNS